MYQSPSAPASIGGVLDDGFRLFTACFKDCLPFLVVMGIAGVIPSMLMPSGAEIQANPELVSEMFGATTLIAFLVSMLLQALCFGATVAAIHRRVTQQEGNLAASFATGLARAPAVVIAAIFYMLALTVGLILLVIPGIWVSVAFLLFGFCCVIDKDGPFRGLKSSHQLIKGNWWRTTVILTVLLVVVLVLYLLFAFVFGAILGVSASSGGMEAMMEAQTSWPILLLTAVLSVPVFMFLVSTQYALYADLKLRKEGGDLAARIDSA